MGPRLTFAACLVPWLLLAGAGALDGFEPLPERSIALLNGDTNGDFERDLSDGIYLLGHLYLGSPAPVTLALCGGEEPAYQNGDSNGDGSLDFSDPIFYLRWLFRGGREPVAVCSESDGAGAGAGDDDDDPDDGDDIDDALDDAFDDVDDDDRVRIVPPERFPGVYSELPALWWQWLLTTPAADLPVLNPDCGAGQSGEVWFLLPANADFDLGTDLTVHCTVPEETAIIAPIATGECSNLPGDTDFGETAEEIIACNNAGFEMGRQVVVPEADINGVSVRDLDRFIVVTPSVFPVGPTAEGNVFGIPAGETGISAAAGWFLLIAPLPEGVHELHIGFSLSFDPSLRVDITYILNVVDDDDDDDDDNDDDGDDDDD